VEEQRLTSRCFLSQIGDRGLRLGKKQGFGHIQRVEQFSGAVTAGIAQGFYPKPAQKTWE
jgi:hypothetical protein